MKKNEKILIFLLVILFLLVLYLILTSESIKQTTNIPEQQVKQDNSVLLENDYKPKVKEVFVVYEELIKNSSFTKENITELKNKLLDLKVPAKFKELHIQFVLALTKMENYLNQKDEEEKSASLQTVSQLKADYSWLN